MFAASKTGRAVAGAVTDPYFPYVPLLLETGASSTRSTTVLDGAATPNTVTRNGTPSTGWTSPYQTTGYWSGYFNGTTASQNSVNPTISAIGTGNFTVEFFYYWDGETGVDQQIVDLGATGFSIYSLTSSANVGVYNRVTNTEIFSPISYAITKNSWVHIAFVRSGTGAGQTALYINGTSVATAAVSSNFSSTTATIGCRYTVFSSNWYPVKGYVSNFRISNIARTITVPTTPYSSDANTLFLGLQSNRFIDSSGTALTVVGSPQTTPYYYPSGFTAPTASPGAGLFNGTSDYLSVPTATALGVSSSDFTVESWVYFTDVTGYQIVFDARTAQPSQSPLVTLQNTSRFLYLWNSASFVGFGPTTLTPNTWYHVAIVRSSGVHTGYVNGVSYSLSTTDAAGVSSAPVILGARTVGGANDYLKGYLSNFRFVKGTAVYTGAFTPPSNFVTQTGGTYPSTTNVNTSIPSANTSLLLNLADSNYTSATNGVQNNTFIDSSNYAFPITRNGTPTQGAFTPYQPSGYWSGYFNGSTDYLSAPSNAAFALGTSDFTIECWIYLVTVPTTFADLAFIGTYGSTANGFFVNFRSSGTLAITDSTTVYASSATALVANTWYHVAAVRSSGSSKIYVNGVGGTAVAFSGSIVQNGFFIGSSGNSGSGFVNGYISNYRVVKGTAVYTGNFTPPTAPLTAITNTSLLTLQSNRFIDNSTNAFAITVNGTPKVQAFQPFAPAASYSAATYGGSGWLPGSSSDYLSVADNTAFNLTTGSWTIEAWAYPTARSATYGSTIVSKRNPGSPYTWAWDVSINPSGYPALLSASITSSILAPLNTWTHIAAVSNGSTITLYVNGVVAAGPTAYTVPSTTGSVYIGNYPTDNPFFTGYLSNIRIVKGAAIYTSAFTPPTLPVTAVSGTSLLTNFTNAGIYDAAWQNNALTVGDAQASISQYKWSPTSMKFDGTLDALSIPPSTSFGLGTGDWTIEFWLYLNSVPSANITLVSMLTSDTSIAPHIYYANGGGVTYYTNSANRISGSALSATTWYYIALTKASGSTKLYINGTQSGATYTDTNNYGTSNPFAVADYKYPLSGLSPLLNGYVQDVRITKGVARTITTPTAAFPTR